MKKFTTFDGSKVDLDDPKTYKNILDGTDDTTALDKHMFSDIGYALCYMKHMHPNSFRFSYGNTQKKRVKKLIEKFCNRRYKNTGNPMWFKKMIFIFEDEIENMC